MELEKIRKENIFIGYTQKKNNQKKFNTKLCEATNGSQLSETLGVLKPPTLIFSLEVQVVSGVY